MCLCRFFLLFFSFSGLIFHKGIESIICLTISIDQTSLAGKDREILIRKYYRIEDKKITTFQRIWIVKTGKKVQASSFKLCKSVHRKTWCSRSLQAQSFLQKRWYRLVVCSWFVGPKSRSGRSLVGGVHGKVWITWLPPPSQVRWKTEVWACHLCFTTVSVDPRSWAHRLKLIWVCNRYIYINPAALIPLGYGNDSVKLKEEIFAWILLNAAVHSPLSEFHFIFSNLPSLSYFLSLCLLIFRPSISFNVHSHLCHILLFPLYILFQFCISLSALLYMKCDSHLQLELDPVILLEPVFFDISSASRSFCRCFYF